jgi:hypothetical protein
MAILGLFGIFGSKSNSDPYSDDLFKKNKPKAKKRDGYSCIKCGKSKSEAEFLDVDHIKPFKKGGTHKLKNLQTLCRECHEKKEPWLKGFKPKKKTSNPISVFIGNVWQGVKTTGNIGVNICLRITLCLVVVGVFNTYT